MMKDIGRDYPHPPGTSVTDHAVLYRIFEEVAETGLPLDIHPHDQSLYDLWVTRASRRSGPISGLTPGAAGRRWRHPQHRHRDHP